MIVKVKKETNLLKIKYISKGKKYKETITGEKEFNVDENSYFAIIKYDILFDNKEKAILYSLKMIFLSVILLLMDALDIQKSTSYYFINYKFKCVSDCQIINGDNLDNESFVKRSTKEYLFNTIYLILSFIFFGLIIFIIGSIKYKK
jgi:hypothetical protein